MNDDKTHVYTPDADLDISIENIRRQLDEHAEYQATRIAAGEIPMHIVDYMSNKLDIDPTLMSQNTYSTTFAFFKAQRAAIESQQRAELNARLAIIMRYHAKRQHMQQLVNQRELLKLADIDDACMDRAGDVALSRESYDYINLMSSTSNMRVSAMCAYVLDCDDARRFATEDANRAHHHGAATVSNCVFMDDDVDDTRVKVSKSRKCDGRFEFTVRLNYGKLLDDNRPSRALLDAAQRLDHIVNDEIDMVDNATERENPLPSVRFRMAPYCIDGAVSELYSKKLVDALTAPASVLHTSTPKADDLITATVVALTALSNRTAPVVTEPAGVTYDELIKTANALKTDHGVIVVDSVPDYMRGDRDDVVHDFKLTSRHVSKTRVSIKASNRDDSRKYRGPERDERRRAKKLKRKAQKQQRK